MQTKIHFKNKVCDNCGNKGHKFPPYRKEPRKKRIRNLKLRITQRKEKTYSQE